jgi:tetratricopeptide (TPR) repeat protein
MVRTIDGKPYIFLELVTGGDLSQWIGTPRLTKDILQILSFAIQFCDGMSHAFTKGVKVHRDIKPSNCLITEDGLLKVTDFGLSKAFANTELETGAPNQNISLTPEFGQGLTQTGFRAGTCTHMAPEQFDDAKHVDVPADIYSFGIMLYQMGTGRLPFTGRTWQDFKHQHQTQRPPPVRSQNHQLDALIIACLEKLPANRHQNFRAVREELGKIFGTLSGKPAPEPVAGMELNARDWCGKGASLSFLGCHQEALACFDQALQMDPKLSLALYNKGNIMATVFRRYDEANALYDQALAINPKEFRAWSNKATMFWSMGRHREQFECCEKALAINPHDARALTLKGIAFAGSEKYEAALDCYNGALIVDPHFVLALINKGIILSSLGRLDEGILLFDHALEQAPNNAQAWAQKSFTLSRLRKHEEAIACADKALSLDNNYGMAWFSKGMSLTAMKRSSEAITCFDRVITLRTSFQQQAWLEKGIVLMQLNNLESAISCLDQAVKLEPRDDYAWLVRGECLEKLSRFNDALQSFDNALSVNQKNVKAWVKKGFLLGVMGNLTDATECIQKAQALGSADGPKLIALLREKLNQR